MRILMILLFASFMPWAAHSQAVFRIEECYEAAEVNYPLTRQRGLIEKTRTLAMENAATGRLPRVSMGGQATYQSDVTQIPVEMPGVEPLSKDQYRIFGEISQTLYHGGVVSHEKEAAELNASVESQQLAVDLYQLRSRVNELFFGILLLREQARQTGLIQADLRAVLDKTLAAIKHGTAIPSSADVLRAELLRHDQRIIETNVSEATYRELLGIFIGETIDADAVLAKPEYARQEPSINRPELQLFELQRMNIESNQALLSARRRPKLELFVQGGYGRPGLNMLENEFDFYYLGGIRFTWQLSGYYTARRENEIFSLRRQSSDVREQTFLFNTRLSLGKHDAEIAKIRRLIEVDNAIIDLRTRVRRTAEVQLEEGVISATDYIREVNSEDQAKQRRALHEIELLMAQANYHFTLGQ